MECAAAAAAMRWRQVRGASPALSASFKLPGLDDAVCWLTASVDPAPSMVLVCGCRWLEVRVDGGGRQWVSDRAAEGVRRSGRVSRDRRST